jgi:hypothetical protein
VINLRYHIISIVAVFLALGIGLALGSTFVDSILVNELEDQVDKFEADRQEAITQKDVALAAKDAALAAKELAVEAKNEIQRGAAAQVERHQTELAGERDAAKTQRDALIEQSEIDVAAHNSLLNTIEMMMPRARLGGTSWILLAPTGIDSALAWKIRDLLTRSDGEYLGTLWIEPTMNFDNPETLDALNRLYGNDQDEMDAADLTISGIVTTLLVQDSLTNSDMETTPMLISELRDIGLLRFDRYLSTRALESISNSANRVLVINDPGHLDLHEGFFVPLLQQISQTAEAGIAALAEVAIEGRSRGLIVNRVRNDSLLAQSLSTFDDVASFEGRLSLLLGLARLPAVGHYGDLYTSEGRFSQ